MSFTDVSPSKPDVLRLDNTSTPTSATQFSAEGRINPVLPLIHLRGDEFGGLQTDTVRGLLNPSKYLLPKYLYDHRGSELFEQITALPEYYLTRCEQEILESSADEILSRAEANFWLVELGAGSGKKTRALLHAMRNRQMTNQALMRYLPIDISEEFLYASSLQLQEEFPAIDMQPICAEFLQGVGYLTMQRNEHYAGTQLLIYFPGSTIGNLTRNEAAEFFLKLRALLRENDVLLLAADMNASPEKPISALHEAYNDAAGVTAAFNLNILHRLNRELAADFPIEAYKHVAYYNAGESRVELFLESTRYHTVSIADYRIEIGLAERIHTEYSHKFNENMIRQMASLANFTSVASWTDAREYFRLYWLCAS